MKTKIECWNCYHPIKCDIDQEDYYEASQGSTFKILSCPSCDKINAITYMLTVKFFTHQPNKEDKKAFKEEIQELLEMVEEE